MEEAAVTGKPAGEAQPPLVFSQSEYVPLGFTNQLLRKAAYGCGVISFMFTGFSGLSDKNRWRTASGFGSAAINVASVCMKERNDPLPNTSLPNQVAHSLLKPNENILFFNRTSTFITDVLKFAAGIQSTKKSEIFEGALKIGSKAIDIAGISDQNKRGILAREMLAEGQLPQEKPSMIHKIFANRWLPLTYSLLAAGAQVRQGFEGKRDNKMLASGIFYFMAVAAHFADNAILESRIKKTHAAQGR